MGATDTSLASKNAAISATAPTSRSIINPLGDAKPLPNPNPKPGESLFGGRDPNWTLAHAVGPGAVNLDTDVKKVQTGARAMGLYDGRIDGWFGPKTEAAVKDGQTMLGQQPDGRVNPLGPTQTAFEQAQATQTLPVKKAPDTIAERNPSLADQAAAIQQQKAEQAKSQATPKPEATLKPQSAPSLKTLAQNLPNLSQKPKHPEPQRRSLLDLGFEAPKAKAKQHRPIQVVGASGQVRIPEIPKGKPIDHDRSPATRDQLRLHRQEAERIRQPAGDYLVRRQRIADMGREADANNPNQAFNLGDLAKELDIDQAQVEKAGLNGHTALLGTSIYRQLPEDGKQEVLKQIDALEKAGHKDLAIQLRGTAAVSDHVQKEWNPITMSDDEIKALIDKNQAMIQTLELLRPVTDRHLGSEAVRTLWIRSLDQSNERLSRISRRRLENNR